MKAFLRRLTTEPLYHYPMDRFLIKSPILYRSEHRVVHVGGGPLRNHRKEWNLNLFRGANIDVVGNAERLPFASGSVDVVISNAVFEHVRDLPAVIAEIERVLKPGGYVYVEIPFLQHYHTHDGRGVRFEDYRRLTKAGLTETLSFCQPLDVGACVGPTSTVLQILYAFALTWTRSARSRRWLWRVYCALGNMVVWIDRAMSDERIQNSTIPCGVYLFGRKPDGATPCLLTLPQPNSIFPRDLKARITVADKRSDRLTVAIANTSRTTWLRTSPLAWGVVNVGLQQRGPAGLDRDFRRIPLPGDISPGERFSIEIERASIDSTATLIVDLVVEGLGWFAERGNPPLEVSWG